MPTILKPEDVWECPQCGFVMADIEYKSVYADYGCPRCKTSFVKFHIKRRIAMETKALNQVIQFAKRHGANVISLPVALQAAAELEKLVSERDTYKSYGVKFAELAGQHETTITQLRADLNEAKQAGYRLTQKLARTQVELEALEKKAEYKQGCLERALKMVSDNNATITRLRAELEREKEVEAIQERHIKIAENQEKQRMVDKLEEVEADRRGWVSMYNRDEETIAQLRERVRILREALQGFVDYFSDDYEERLAEMQEYQTARAALERTKGG